MKRAFITVTTDLNRPLSRTGIYLMKEDGINWNDRVHLCLRSGRRGVRNTQLFTGVLDEAIHAALARPVEERDRLVIKYEFTSRRLTWNRIAELAGRADFPMLI